jgi:hypothetical protein
MIQEGVEAPAVNPILPFLASHLGLISLAVSNLNMIRSRLNFPADSRKPLCIPAIVATHYHHTIHFFGNLQCLLLMPKDFKWSTACGLWIRGPKL